MDTSVWTSALPNKEAGKLIVGWFHSHPNLGAFFSGTDRATQRNFFAHDYSLGYVIDPVRKEDAYFIGRCCNELDSRYVLTYQSSALLLAALS